MWQDLIQEISIALPLVQRYTLSAYKIKVPLMPSTNSRGSTELGTNCINDNVQKARDYKDLLRRTKGS